ncbi:MBL fold metallo-hydrolase [Jiulongibacter sp. NS-SX5]|uniref:MBL fold metallo-hydrolase n=1 Tax=Jiulongibacter sp. NS-SX5 TaxID=3463854 RepID=UPI0040599287
MKSFHSFQSDEVQAYRFGYQLIGKPRLFTHIYFIDGLLIDTGQHTMQKEILATTQNLDIKQIFITHHHEDHSGNIKALQKQHNCPVYASPACCMQMQNPPPLSFAQKITWGNRPPSFDLKPIEGVLNTTNYNFQLIPIPGHASDMFALYEPTKKWLFSADLFLGVRIQYFLYSESMLQQIESIKRVLELDFAQLFCSHNPQLTAGREKLEAKLAFLSDFYESVEHYHAKGFDTKEIFKAMKLKENRFFVLISGGDLSKMNMVRSAIRDLENLT